MRSGAFQLPAQWRTMKLDKSPSEIISEVSRAASDQAGHVFICYPRRAESVAVELVSTIKQFGKSVWIDLEHLDRAQNIKPQLLSAIQGSAVFLLIADAPSNESSWVSFESETAQKLLGTSRIITTQLLDHDRRDC